jgi:hypothetical protein
MNRIVFWAPPSWQLAHVASINQLINFELNLREMRSMMFFVES